MKVLVALGTRPEVIKLAPVITELIAHNIETVVCATGQHREMLTQALEAFAIRPDFSLDTMSPGQSLNILSSRILAEMDGVLAKEQPDWVLVQGDTTTAFCAGLAAFHRGIRIGHVEAGLRTGDLASPFPEEANRSLLARITSRHFAPTITARDNLLAEGIAGNSIIVTGNTVVDAIVQAQASLAHRNLNLPESTKTLLANKPLVLVTCHRRENFGEVLQGICQMLSRLCSRYTDYQWVFPVHLNPAVREPVMQILSNIPNLTLLDPVDYYTSLYLISRSALVVSDSGGIQEEAPSFGVPVVVMRSHTERMEGVNAGFATLAGQASEYIEQSVSAWLNHPERRLYLKDRSNPYGDGLASKRIAACLLDEPFEVFNG